MHLIRTLVIEYLAEGHDELAELDTPLYLFVPHAEPLDLLADRAQGQQELQGIDEVAHHLF